MTDEKRTATDNSATKAKQPTAIQKQRYGGWAPVVILMQDAFSKENAKIVRDSGLFNSTYYKEFTPMDLVRIHDRFPNVYEDFRDMWIDANMEAIRAKRGEPFTESDRRDQTQARNAMAVLSSDGDWQTFSNLVLESSRLLRPKTIEQKPPQLQKQRFEFGAPDAVLEAVRGLRGKTDVKLEDAHEVQTPAALLQAVEQLKANDRGARAA